MKIKQYSKYYKFVFNNFDVFSLIFYSIKCLYSNTNVMIVERSLRNWCSALILK